MGASLPPRGTPQLDDDALPSPLYQIFFSGNKEGVELFWWITRGRKCCTREIRFREMPMFFSIPFIFIEICDLFVYPVLNKEFHFPAGYSLMITDPDLDFKQIQNWLHKGKIRFSAG
jgi:hypothetical protein